MNNKFKDYFLNVVIQDHFNLAGPACYKGDDVFLDTKYIANYIKGFPDKLHIPKEEHCLKEGDILQLRTSEPSKTYYLLLLSFESYFFIEVNSKNEKVIHYISADFTQEPIEFESAIQTINKQYCQLSDYHYDIYLNYVANTLIYRGMYKPTHPDLFKKLLQVYPDSTVTPDGLACILPVKDKEVSIKLGPVVSTYSSATEIYLTSCTEYRGLTITKYIQSDLVVCSCTTAPVNPIDECKVADFIYNRLNINHFSEEIKRMLVTLDPNIYGFINNPSEELTKFLIQIDLGVATEFIDSFEQYQDILDKGVVYHNNLSYKGLLQEDRERLETAIYKSRTSQKSNNYEVDFAGAILQKIFNTKENYGGFREAEYLAESYNMQNPKFFADGHCRTFYKVLFAIMLLYNYDVTVYYDKLREVQKIYEQGYQNKTIKEFYIALKQNIPTNPTSKTSSIAAKW